jgi:hypothetical protein
MVGCSSQNCCSGSTNSKLSGVNVSSVMKYLRENAFPSWNILETSQNSAPCCTMQLQEQKDVCSSEPSHAFGSQSLWMWTGDFIFCIFPRLALSRLPAFQVRHESSVRWACPWAICSERVTVGLVLRQCWTHGTKTLSGVVQQYRTPYVVFFVIETRYN